MKLSDIYTQLNNARAAHKVWVARAEAMVEGMPIEKEQIPLLHTDCVFGKWYYGEGQAVRNLPAYATIEKPHQALHSTYFKIFKCLFDEPDVSMFGKLLGKQKKAKDKQLTEAKTLIVHLRKQSDDICETLDTLEDQIRRAVQAQQKARQKNNADAADINKQLDQTIDDLSKL